MPDVSHSDVFVSGGSAPSFGALDTAKNGLDALNAAKADADNAIRDILWKLSLVAVASGKDYRRACEGVADVLADLTYDRERDLKDEIEALEIGLEDVS